MSLFNMVRMRLVGARRNRINPCNIHDVEVFEKEAEKEGKSKKEENITRMNRMNSFNIFMCRQMMKLKVITSKSYWKTFYLDNSEAPYYKWLFVISLAVFYNLFAIVARTVFWNLQDDYFVMWLCFDYFCDFLYLIDIYVQHKTAFLEQGIIVTDATLMKKHYRVTTRAKVDVLSILPTDFLYFLWTPDQVVVRLNRLLRIPRLSEFFDQTENRSGHPNLVRISTLVFYILVIIHWNACIYFQVSHWLGFGTDDWVYPSVDPYLADGRVNLNSTFPYMYLTSFLWSTLTLTTIGDLPPPVRDEEFVFMILDFLVGVFIFVSIVGQVGSMLTNMNASRREFQEKLDAVKRYLEVRKVGKELEMKVVKWFDYLWSNNYSLDGEASLAILPAKLKAEIATNVHLGSLKRVAIFKECEVGLLAELVLKLKEIVFSPGDYVCRKGDIGKELYIIKSGKLQVVGDDGTTVFATLMDGTVFGEISVLNIAGNKNGNRRTANIRSLGYSDLFVLSKEDLWQALEEYPDARRMLIEKGRQMLRKDNLLDEDAAKKQDMDCSSHEEKLENIEMQFQSISKRLGKLVEEAYAMESDLTSKLISVEKAIVKKYNKT